MKLTTETREPVFSLDGKIGREILVVGAQQTLVYSNCPPKVANKWYWMRHKGEKRGCPIYVSDLDGLNIPYYADCVWSEPIDEPGN